MKKILNLALIASAVFSFSAFAADGDVELTAGELVSIVDTPKNVSQSINIIALGDRAGFVKNDFSITTSANVAIAAIDDNTRFGVAAGANRGRAVFTGTSEGGSVAQCGPLVAKDTDNGGASLVEAEGTLDFTADNGCGIVEE